MKPLGIISQILLSGLTVAVVTFFIQPNFTEIGELQNEMQEFSLERERVSETNQLLASRVSELESIAVSDRDRLSTYLPMVLDEVAVLRDIEIIANNAGVDYAGIIHSGEIVDSSEETRLSQSDKQIVGQGFSVTAIGNYNQLKDFLSMLEQNAYPLQVYSLKIDPLDGGFLSAELALVTYVTKASSETE
ncbi:MAG: hypothetical protein ACI9SY_000530 [Candidatus Paceibacteria bacterium]|jgi:hypothetical protein